MTGPQALLFNGATAAAGMAMGACLNLSPMGAVKGGAIAMVVVLSTVTRTLGDKGHDGPEWGR